MKASHVEPSQAFGGGLGWVPLAFPAAGKQRVPYRFQIAPVYGATAVTGVQVGKAGVLNTNIIASMATPAGDVTPMVAVFTAPVADRRGMPGDYVEVTGGTTTVVWVRPYPMKGEA